MSTHHNVHPSHGHPSHGPPITLFTQHIVNHHMVHPSQCPPITSSTQHMSTHHIVHPSHHPPITLSTHHIVHPTHVHPTHSPPINLTELKDYECFRSFPQVGVPPPLYTIGCVNFDKVYRYYTIQEEGVADQRTRDKIIWTNNIKVVQGLMVQLLKKMFWYTSKLYFYQESIKQYLMTIGPYTKNKLDLVLQTVSLRHCVMQSWHETSRNLL